MVRRQLFDPPYPFQLRIGEIGCFLSHRQIWAEIVRRGLPAAFIIEDDAGLDPARFDTAMRLARFQTSRSSKDWYIRGNFSISRGRYIRELRV